MSKTLLAATAILIGITSCAFAAIDPAHVANPSLGRQAASPGSKTLAWLFPAEPIIDNRVIIENRSGAFDGDAPLSGTNQ